MAVFEMTEPQLTCPTSGPMLRAMVHAFRLSREDAEKGTSSLVGSAESERNERRYFEGEVVVSDELRHRVAGRVASALIETGLVGGLRIAAPSAFSTAQDVLTSAVFGWLTTWDAVYHQCSVGWPYAPRSLGAFVLGREVVIDLVLRIAALLHLTDGTQPSDLAVYAAMENAGAGILQAAMRDAGREMAYIELAEAAVVDRRTAQRWLNESLAPEDHNLRQLAHVLAGNDEKAERGILNRLRVQYGALRVAQLLETLCGARWTRELFQGFERLLRCAVESNEEVRADPRAFDSTADGLDLAQVELLTKGSTSVVAPAVMALWLQRQHPAIWAYELHLASAMSLKQRLERCFQTIGNWPQFWKNGLPANAVLGFSAAQYQTRLESTALATLCPPLREMFEQQPPAHPDVGVPRELEQLIHRAVTCQTEGRAEESLPLWTEVLRQVPANADFACYYGIALRSAGRRQEALEAMRRAAELDPASERPHIEIARTYLDQGLPDLALHHLEAVPADMRGRSAEMLWVMGELLFHEERYGDALVVIEQSIALDSENADAHDLAARALLRMPHCRENRERAAEHAKKAGASQRRGGLTEWRNTKRHKPS